MTMLRSALLNCHRFANILIALSVLGLPLPLHAQDQNIPGDVHIQTGSPEVFFEDNVGTNYIWKVWADDFSFDIVDVTNGKIPLRILSNAPSSSFFVNSSGQVGLGTNTPQTTIHSYSTTGPTTIRFQDSSSISRTWDIEGGGSGFIVKEVNEGTSPFVISPYAPSNSLFVSTTGNVGVGTALPTQIGSAALAGRVVNVRNDAGFASIVCQGNGAGFTVRDFNGAVNGKNLRMRVQSGFATYEVINDTFSATSIPNLLSLRMTNGNVGLKTQADINHPLKLGNGAYCTAGGVWTNASSRTLKEDIAELPIESARATMRDLKPVSYRYRNEPDEKYIGFIAEDVPELVATNDRKSLAPMDVVGVLTKVVQDQDQTIQLQDRKVNDQARLLEEQRAEISRQKAALSALSERLLELEQKVGVK